MVRVRMRMKMRARVVSIVDEGDMIMVVIKILTFEQLRMQRER